MHASKQGILAQSVFSRGGIKSKDLQFTFYALGRPRWAPSSYMPVTFECPPQKV
jgi:hypothetical protein